MKFISHRGNIEKKIIEEENDPKKILYCISLGYDVEIDVWKIKDTFYLGHDEPQHEIDKTFLFNKNLWCHAKNLNVLEDLLWQRTINCFWHENDKFTVTSHGYIWTYPGNEITINSIIVLPENSNYSNSIYKIARGICSDNIKLYKDIYENFSYWS